MRLYASSKYCRRWNILNYFGQQARIDGCGCDVCRGKVKQPPERRAATQKRSAARSSGDRKPRKLKTDDIQPLDASGERRFELLCELRRRLAARDGVPAFCVMHDRVLLEVARRAPDNVAALLQIPGIGPKIAAKYGEAFLSAIRQSRSQK